MPSTMTPNMSLTLPSVGTEPGPDYALDINNDMSTIDQHDHTSGNGVPIPSAGININTDLSFGGNNAVQLRSARFSPQLAPLALGTDLGCLYESGVDLYYNDGNGNQIRITAAGSVAGATGSITGLTSPASASYSAGSGTFTWQSNSNIAANMDFRSAILRNSSVSSNGITLSAPISLPGNYSLTLPSTLPGSQNFMSLDSSGNIAANWAVDNSTIVISSNTVQVPAQGITATQIANATITGAQIVSGVHLDGDPLLRGTSFYMVGQAADSPLNIIRGQLNADGTTALGAGFTSTRLSTGNYQITFAVAFSATPIVLVNCVDLTSAGPVVSSPQSSGISTTQATWKNVSSGIDVNEKTSFLIVGPR